MNLKFTLTWLALAAGLSTSATAESIHIVDESGGAVANATILFGFEPGNPFPNNVLNTGMDGSMSIPGDWKAALPVTVQAAGFITTTLPILMPGEHTIVITHSDPAGKFEVKGTTTHYGRLITDGKVDFGLVIPALSRESMLGFDIGTVLSPESDTISIVGKNIDIPSNVSLPNQSETYIFPITLNKPEYRVYLRQTGDYRLFALHGQFPLQKVVNDIQAGKSMFEVINHFNFLEVGQKQISVNGNLSNLDLEVNQTPFNSTVSVRAPAFAAGKVMVGLALSETNGLYTPTDLKRFTPGQAMDLKTNAALGTGSILSLLLDEPSETIVTRVAEALLRLDPLTSMIKPHATGGPAAGKKYNFKKMSFVLNGAGPTVAPTFLPMIDPPQLSGDVMLLYVPALNDPALVPVATYLVLAETEELGTGSVKSERRARLWEVWSPGWLSQVELPKVSFVKKPNLKYRWEVLFMAGPAHAATSATEDRMDLSRTSHITRNAIDL